MRFLIRVREFIFQLLLVDFFRYLVAKVRYLWFCVYRVHWKFVETGDDVMKNTVHHNIGNLNTYTKLISPRSNFILFPLSGLRLSRSAPILCIGPRSEGELLTFKGLGFRNVRGLGLFTYSPWIDAGDMHKMPYADGTFAVTSASWCLGYSNNMKQAAAEMLRVTKPGGLIIVGDEFTNETNATSMERHGYELSACGLKDEKEVLDLFAGHVKKVLYTRDRPEPAPHKYDIVVIFQKA